MIGKLEGIVRERTPQYVSWSNPQYDEKLMKAHYLLAKLYGREGITTQAHAHFRDAENEFFDMCRVRTKQPDYVSGDKGFRRLREINRRIERELEHYKGKLFGIANEIGYDATDLILAPTNDNPTKENLAELIKELV